MGSIHSAFQHSPPCSPCFCCPACCLLLLEPPSCSQAWELEARCLTSLSPSLSRGSTGAHIQSKALGAGVASVSDSPNRLHGARRLAAAPVLSSSPIVRASPILQSTPFVSASPIVRTSP